MEIDHETISWINDMQYMRKDFSWVFNEQDIFHLSCFSKLGSKSFQRLFREWNNRRLQHLKLRKKLMSLLGRLRCVIMNRVLHCTLKTEIKIFQEALMTEKLCLWFLIYLIFTMPLIFTMTLIFTLQYIQEWSPLSLSVFAKMEWGF